MRSLSGTAARRAALCAIFLSIGLTLSACRTSPGTRPAPSPGAQSGASTVPAAATHYAIDSQRSEVLVLVYRDGRLAHNWATIT